MRHGQTRPGFDRRRFLTAGSAAGLIAVLPACRGPVASDGFMNALRELESDAGGRLGVALLNVNADAAVGHRQDERFGMCSTFKLPLAAIVLREVDAGQLRLEQRVNYTVDDMVPYAPVTETFLERGYMTVEELAEAAQTTSDNVAANLLLRLIDGPAGFTRRLREIGDEVTRLDRYEPEMNLVPAGEIRDTTTPEAMARTVRDVVAGAVLSGASREQLVSWTEATRTGLSRLRGGFPVDWRAGDKTGTGIASGMANKYNDVAIAWPGDGTPAFVLAAYYEADGHYNEMRDRDVAVLARVGELAAAYAAMA